MTDQVDRSQDTDTCRKLISLGFARSNRVRLYGLEVELISDPFPLREGGIGVEVVETNAVSSRTLRLPLPVLQVAGKKPMKRSA
ncbi:MAG: hypothetical protein JO159_13905 [Acidobacteria bacterium]|nr:hypothetical protein [Acidobacteriota bacterium]